MKSQKTVENEQQMKRLHEESGTVYFGPTYRNHQWPYFQSDRFYSLCDYLSKHRPRLYKDMEYRNDLSCEDEYISKKLQSAKWFSILNRYVEACHLFVDISPLEVIMPGDDDWVDTSSLRNLYIYFLLNREGDILYIGQTNNCEVRFTQHKQGAIIPFDKTVSVEFPNWFAPATVTEIEREFIALFDPPYNTIYSSNSPVGRLANWNVNFNIDGNPETVALNRLLYDTMASWLGCPPSRLARQLFLIGYHHILGNYKTLCNKVWHELKLEDDPFTFMVADVETRNAMLDNHIEAIEAK